jgi:hypothetical protein
MKQESIPIGTTIDAKATCLVQPHDPFSGFRAVCRRARKALGLQHPVTGRVADDFEPGVVHMPPLRYDQAEILGWAAYLV